MPKVALYNKSGAVVGEVELCQEIFGIDPNGDAVHQVITAHLANKRQGTQSALTRAEVSGGGIKPWRQKGTGRARQGSTRSPQWRHGGIVFAPKPRDYSQSVNKKMKRLALKSALSAKVQSEDFIVVDALDIDAKTKQAAAALKALKAEKALIVLTGDDANMQLAARNIPGVATIRADMLSAYEVLKYKRCVITQPALELVEEVYA